MKNFDVITPVGLASQSGCRGFSGKWRRCRNLEDSTELENPCAAKVPATLLGVGAGE
jgi:hypothetical protein